MTRLRSYYESGKLNSWMQERCEICQRFLGKHQSHNGHKYCARCSYKNKLSINAKLNKEYKLRHREYLTCSEYLRKRGWLKLENFDEIPLNRIF